MGPFACFVVPSERSRFRDTGLLVLHMVLPAKSRSSSISSFALLTSTTSGHSERPLASGETSGSHPPTEAQRGKNRASLPHPAWHDRLHQRGRTEVIQRNVETFPGCRVFDALFTWPPGSLGGRIVSTFPRVVVPGSDGLAAPTPGAFDLRKQTHYQGDQGDEGGEGGGSARDGEKRALTRRDITPKEEQAIRPGTAYFSSTFFFAASASIKLCNWSFPSTFRSPVYGVLSRHHQVA
jgi:hypothetical protein